MRRNEKGITLVALVVTIIVLLILAGVSLSLVAGGNGILTRASNSVQKNAEATAKEQAELKVAELVSEFYENTYANGTTYSTGVNQDGTTPLEYIGKDTTGATYQSDDGKYEIKVTTAATNNITVTGNVSGSSVSVTGTMGTNGTITW